MSSRVRVRIGVRVRSRVRVSIFYTHVDAMFIF